MALLAAVASLATSLSFSSNATLRSNLDKRCANSPPLIPAPIITTSYMRGPP